MIDDTQQKAADLDRHLSEQENADLGYEAAYTALLSESTLAWDALQDVAEGDTWPDELNGIYQALQRGTMADGIAWCKAGKLVLDAIAKFHKALAEDR